MIYFRQIIPYDHRHLHHHHRLRGLRRLQPHCLLHLRKHKLKIELLLRQLERHLPFQLLQVFIFLLALCDLSCSIYLDWLTRFWFGYPQDVFDLEWC